ncbi:hypothetical protein RchiOBHm_CPg0502381 (chloroplast) [Rosa chinensis]|uniref:Uncharacterized protein n=1 Tax=Rosa chinensis TaxID=74649 RepID=A0A2P6P1B1_ROSCH|nr:hypothetical protein RchiOBHm_CPg0502381 [Rosa chinensis]
MNRLLLKLDMDREEELHFFYFTFLFPFIQRENSSVITLRRYTFSIGNNTDIVVL